MAKLHFIKFSNENLRCYARTSCFVHYLLIFPVCGFRSGRLETTNARLVNFRWSRCTTVKWQRTFFVETQNCCLLLCFIGRVLRVLHSAASACFLNRLKDLYNRTQINYIWVTSIGILLYVKAIKTRGIVNRKVTSRRKRTLLREIKCLGSERRKEWVKAHLK